MAVKNQAHPRDPQNPRNPILESVWCPMATPNFTLINSLCCCLDFFYFFMFGGLTTVLQFWGNNKLIKRKQSKLSTTSDQLLSSNKLQQELVRLILVKLGVVMDVPADLKFGFPRS